ncbi:hypothetical protein CPB84DRAFT_1769767 [Gymnopilus junonius]|uniref:Secreted protein n=1 Tax=Gymnopilus junonius TaxID=109634 RepID=A0A9P5TQK2_GYMJU|nr:hypothetical protein CPB84DRAFT_1769767 [Gymnopilus junonius]
MSAPLLSSCLFSCFLSCSTMVDHDNNNVVLDLPCAVDSLWILNELSLLFFFKLPILLPGVPVSLSSPDSATVKRGYTSQSSLPRPLHDQ